MASNKPRDAAVVYRETYAMTAGALFCSFKQLSDSTDPTDETHWTRFVESIKGSDNDGTLWNVGIDILHNMDDRKTAQKMKNAVEPLEKVTKYEKVEDDDDAEEKKKKRDNPNAIDFSLFDDNDERSIDDDYHVLEGYLQRTEQSSNHFINCGDVHENHIISARLTEQGSMLSHDVVEPSHRRARNAQARLTQALQNSGSTSNQIPTNTFLTFVAGSLIGGNYDDIYPDSDHEEMDNDNQSAACEDVFQGVQSTHRQNTPTLVGVAQNVAQEEGKQLDKKQYIAYEIVACSFLLCLLDMDDNIARHSIGLAFSNLDQNQKE